MRLPNFPSDARLVSEYAKWHPHKLIARTRFPLDTSVPFDRAPFAADMCEWEQAWSRQTNALPVTPADDAIAVARRCAVRYRDLMLSP